MALVDELVTILRVGNLPQYEAGLLGASGAAAGLSKSLDTKTGLAGAANLAGAALSGVIALAPELVALTGVIAFLHKAVSAFSEDEDILRRFAVQLRNMGESSSLNAVIEQANELSKATGIDDEEIVKITSTLERFGVTAQQSMKLVEPILNTAAASGHDLNTVAEAFGRANQGFARGLRSEGIIIQQGVRGQRALAEAVAQADEKFRSLAAARRDTLGGSLGALSTGFENFASAVGRLLSPILVPAINKLADALNQWAEEFEAVADRLGIRRPTDLPALSASTTGTDKNIAQERTLQRVAEGVENVNDALVNRVLGGPGTVAKGAATLRDYRIAFGA